MEKKIELNVLKTFDEAITRRGKTRIQVVRWGNYSPVLEKRDFWVDEKDEENPGREKPGKLKGLNIDDVELIEQNLEEIKSLLEKE